MTFHRQRRAVRQTHTELLDIPGIGPKTSQRLLQKYGSVANLRRATVEELSRVVARKSAEKIVEYYGGPGNTDLTVIDVDDS